MKTLVAFTGRARSGKNTAATIWSDYDGEQTGAMSVEFAFANILKDIANRSLKITADEYELLKAAPGVKLANGQTMREYVNLLGDAIKSYFGDDAWVRQTLEGFDSIIEVIGAESLIITDLRYPIEQEGLEHFCKARGFELIVIKMKNLNMPQRSDNLSQAEHESEYLVDQIKEDYLIEARSVEEILGQTIKIYHEIHKEIGEQNESTKN